ncbi:hypothetical protein QQM39_08920 [Streptomyces sp. DT2A-34]|uniref:hypothetical protein n=1 Tax=Streptomyces sp. DT2A-34 TaxID=3051182 RepID=UPI00265C11AE|nr:hypothetical protein [Streptomyces sp. DT2A-34]MDO0910972.1 hypothetical protein [Streptomyces sp. DT2A-34]
MLTVVAAGPPLALVVRDVRRGRLADWHIVDRASRIRPLLLTGCCFLGAWAVHLVGAGPSVLGTVVAALTLAVVVGVAVTRFWKISVHTTVCALAVTALAFDVGIGLLGLAPVVALVAWSRVRLNSHTVAQTLAGAAVGTLASAVAFLASARPV